MRRNFKNLMVLAVAALSIVGVFADTSLPKVKILGKRFYYYETKRDESLYGIAKRYGWDPELLKRTNPEAKSNPERGTLLYYPVGKEISEFVEESEDRGLNEATSDATAASVSYGSYVVENIASSSIYHTVEADESLYGIARKYDLSLDQLISLNPNVSNGSLHEGMLLRIKEDDAALMPTGATASQESTTSYVPAVADVKREASSYGDNSFLNADKESSNDSYPEVNVAIVLTDIATSVDDKRTKMNKEMEFARGALTAVDNFKDETFKTQLMILDGSKEASEIRRSLASFNPRMIITTSDRSIPEYIISYADSAKVMVVNSFDARDENYVVNPNVVQYLAPSSYMNSEVAEYVANSFKDYKLLVAGSVEASDALGNAVIEMFSRLGTDKVTEIDIPEIPEMELTDEWGKYLIYGTPTSQKDVKALLEKVNDLRNRNMLADIRVLGRPNWIPYATSLKELLGINYSYVPSRFYFDPENSLTSEFINHYESLFSLRPMKASPVYCATSYDIINYFVPTLAGGQDITESFSAYRPIQSPMSLERIVNAGIVNKGVYMICFMPFGQTDIISLPE